MNSKYGVEKILDFSGMSMKRSTTIQRGPLYSNKETENPSLERCLSLQNFSKKIFLSLLSSGPSFRWQIADFKSLHYANATYILDYILNTVDENENIVLPTWGMIGMIFKRA